MEISTHIGIWDDVISAVDCQKIIDMYEKNKQKHMIGETVSGKDLSMKITMDLCIDAELDKECDSIIFNALNECLLKYIEKYNIRQNWFPSNIADTGYLMMKYEKGKGVFNEHVDNNMNTETNKFLAGLIYLNTIKKGGTTEFPSQKVSIKAISGRVVIFPPFFTHNHKATTPISKDKYVISSFFINSKIN